MFDAARLRERFTELCTIPSPSGEERQIADRVIAELRRLGLAVEEDGAAEAAGAAAGNLTARLPGRGGPDGPWVMFCAHLDTVAHSEPIEVRRDGDRFVSAGPTILGADNKAAVAVLLELVAGWAEAGRGGGDLLAAAGPPAGIELVFTVAEEVGLRGAREYDVAQLRSGYGFVLDHASPIGELIVAGPTYLRFAARFTGVEAHAGIRPEQGRSAIAAAARAIAALELGRIDAETTVNVGRIEGGSGDNVVAGACTLSGEVRSLDREVAAAKLSAVAGACADAAELVGCDLALSSEQVFQGYRAPSGAASLAVAREALQRRGGEPVETVTGGGSDVNALLAKGFECLLLANGTEDNHTAQESVTGEALERMLAVCDSILEVAAERAA